MAMPRGIGKRRTLSYQGMPSFSSTRIHGNDPSLRRRLPSNVSTLGLACGSSPFNDSTSAISRVLPSRNLCYHSGPYSPALRYPPQSHIPHVNTQRHDVKSFVLPPRSMETLEMSQACHFPSHVCHVSLFNYCADTRRWFECACPLSKRPKVARERVPSISEIRAKKSAQEEMFQTSRSNRVALNKRQPPPPLVKLPEKNVTSRLNREQCILSHPGRGPQKGTPATEAMPVGVSASCILKGNDKGHRQYSPHVSEWLPENKTALSENVSSNESGEDVSLPHIKGRSRICDETCNGSRPREKLLTGDIPQLLSQAKPLPNAAKQLEHLQEIKSVPKHEEQPLKSVIAKRKTYSAALFDECATCALCNPAKEVKLLGTKQQKSGSPDDTPFMRQELHRKRRCGPRDTREPHKNDSSVQRRPQTWARDESQLCQGSPCISPENGLINRMDFQKKSDYAPCNDAKMHTDKSDIKPNLQPTDGGGLEKSMTHRPDDRPPIISNEPPRDRPCTPRFEHHQKQQRTMGFDERYEGSTKVPNLYEQHPQIVRALSQGLLPQTCPNKQCGESQRPKSDLECDGLQVKQITTSSIDLEEGATSPTRECRNEPTKLDQRVEKRMPKMPRSSKLVALLRSDMKEESITPFCGGYAYDHQSLPKIVAVHTFVRDGNQKPSQRTYTALSANEIEQWGESQTRLSREISIAGGRVSNAPHTTKNNRLSEDILAKEVQVAHQQQPEETANLTFSKGKDFDIQQTNSPETSISGSSRDNCGDKDPDNQSGSMEQQPCVESSELSSKIKVSSIEENCRQESLCRRKKATVGDLSRKILETRYRIEQEEITWKKKLLYSLEGVLMKKLKKLEKETGEKADISIVENEKDKTGSNGQNKRERRKK